VRLPCILPRSARDVHAPRRPRTMAESCPHAGRYAGASRSSPFLRKRGAGRRGEWAVPGAVGQHLHPVVARYRVVSQASASGKEWLRVGGQRRGPPSDRAWQLARL
jgi:hypothetical protein